MKTITLTQGKVALVDDEDWEFLHLVKWYAQRHGRTFYAVRSLPRDVGGRKKEHMHRLVLARKLGRDIKPGMQCDHEDGNGLNNQRFNLFEKTRRENGENRHHPKTSPFVGVSKHKCGKWRADIRVPDKKLYLGVYATELEAALAREAYIEAHPELGAFSIFSRLDKTTTNKGNSL